MKTTTLVAFGIAAPLALAVLPAAATPLKPVADGLSIAGSQVTDVAYRNNPASIMELLSGECDLNFATPAAVVEHVKSGQLRLLAVSSDKRMPNLPNVPTLAESGYPELTASFWTALHAPAGTPPEMIARLNAAPNRRLSKNDLAKNFGLTAGDVTDVIEHLLSKHAIKVTGEVITAIN